MKLFLKKRIILFLNKYNTFIVLLVLVLFGWLNYDNFLTKANLLNLARQGSMLGIMSVGMTFVLLTGGTDLGVGSIMALAGVIVTKLSDTAPELGVLIAIVVSLALGALSGLLVAQFKVAPFIATLCIMQGARGVVHISTNSASVNLNTERAAWFYEMENTKIASIPLGFIILLVTILIAFYVLKYTRFGRDVYAVGGNATAAEMMGLNVKKRLFMVYVISGFTSGLAGLLMCSRLGAAYPLTGVGWEMKSIAAVVLGGTLLTGGVGSIWGTLVGTLIMGIVGNLINLQGTLGTAWQNIINGAALLVAVLLMQLQKRGTANRAIESPDRIPLA